jgi:hypothetical protein
LAWGTSGGALADVVVVTAGPSPLTLEVSVLATAPGVEDPDVV